MPDPFIVWAPQRTGGTSLFKLLSQFCGREQAWFEPFNPGNRAGHIPKRYRNTKDATRLAEDMARMLGKRMPIKNCYELHPVDVQAACFDTAQALGFRHAILDRRDDTSRIFSRELALLTGAWGKAKAERVYPEYLSGEKPMPPMDKERCLKSLRSGMRRRRWLIQRMRAAGVTPHIVFFEDVFGPDADGEAEVARLFGYLGLPADHPDYPGALRTALHKSSQNSPSVRALVPNLEEVRTALRKAGAERNPWARFNEEPAVP